MHPFLHFISFIYLLSLAFSFGYKWKSLGDDRFFSIKKIENHLQTIFIQQFVSSKMINLSNLVRLKYDWKKKSIEPLFCSKFSFNNIPLIFSLRLFSNRFGFMIEGGHNDLFWNVNVHHINGLQLNAFLDYSC